MATKNAALQLIQENQEKTPLVDRVQNEATRAGLTQGAIAKEAGVSPAVVTRWLKGAYPGDVAAVDRKMARWLDARELRRQVDARLPEAPGWVDTPTSARILAALAYAQMAGDVAVIYGTAGLGKTAALKRQGVLSPNVWVVTMGPAFAGVASALQEVAETIGLREVPGRAARLHREIVQRLRDTRGLLAIDEAQHLSVPALEAMRALHDATGVGLALAGNETVYARLTGGSRSITFAQMFSRIGKRLHLTRPSAEDVRALAVAWGLARPEEQAVLVDIARQPGALRAVTKTLRLAGMFASGEEPAVGIEPKHLRAAWRDLGGEA